MRTLVVLCGILISVAATLQQERNGLGIRRSLPDFAAPATSVIEQNALLWSFNHSAQPMEIIVDVKRKTVTMGSTFIPDSNVEVHNLDTGALIWAGKDLGYWSYGIAQSLQTGALACFACQFNQQGCALFYWPDVANGPSYKWKKIFLNGTVFETTTIDISNDGNTISLLYNTGTGGFPNPSVVAWINPALPNTVHSRNIGVSMSGFLYMDDDGSSLFYTDLQGPDTGLNFLFTATNKTLAIAGSDDVIAAEDNIKAFIVLTSSGDMELHVNTGTTPGQYKLAWSYALSNASRSFLGALITEHEVFTFWFSTPDSKCYVLIFRFVSATPTETMSFSASGYLSDPEGQAFAATPDGQHIAVGLPGYGVALLSRAKHTAVQLVQHNTVCGVKVVQVALQEDAKSVIVVAGLITAWQDQPGWCRGSNVMAFSVAV